MEKAAQDGFDKKFFETVLHQLEFQAKKTKEQRGLGYVAHMVPFCLHEGDALSFFKIDEYSKKVRQEFDEGSLFQGLIKKYLLDNPHKLRLLHVPEKNFQER